MIKAVIGNLKGKVGVYVEDLFSFDEQTILLLAQRNHVVSSDRRFVNYWPLSCQYP